MIIIKDNKKIKMILVDMDGCLVNYPNEPFHSSWDALAQALSEEKKKEWFAIRNFYVKTKDKYKEWFDKQCFLLKGLSKEEAEKVLFPIPYSKGAKQFFQGLDKKYIKGIVSSGINIVAEKAKEELQFDFFISNILNIENGFFNGKGLEVIEIEEKAKKVEKISEQYNIQLEDICFIGDNFNDAESLKIVGYPIAFNPKGEGLIRCINKIKGTIIYDFMEINKILN